MTIFSGIQPSGRLHVGNYLGAVRNWLRLQEDHTNQCFFCIVDWHSLTEDYDPTEKAAQIHELAAELLALGIGTPSRSPSRRGGEMGNVTFFRQSDLPEHLELAWYFACVTPVGEMERMTQYKDKVAHGESPNTGLFTYPVLMAADILAYSSQPPATSPKWRTSTRTLPAGGSGLEALGVPVGHDQIQHLELANDVARRFNSRFGATFSAVQPLLTEAPRVMSLKDPTRKMSKSLGGDHCLFLDDTPEEVERKIRSAVTDTKPTPSRSPSRREGEKREKNFPTSRCEGGRGGVGMSPGVQTLFELLDAFGSKSEIVKFRNAHDAGSIKYSELKPAVAHAFSKHFTEFRKRKAELLVKPERVDAILAQGAEVARSVAGATLDIVRKRVGVR